MSISNQSRPTVAVSAVVSDGERVLVVQRGRPPNQGLWSVPGGRVEWGETLRQAVAREVQEETGLTIQVGPLVEVVERVDVQADPAYHYIIIDFLARPVGGALQAGDDAADARWVTLVELETLPTTAGLTPVLVKALDMARSADIWQREAARDDAL